MTDEEREIEVKDSIMIILIDYRRQYQELSRKIDSHIVSKKGRIDDKKHEELRKKVVELEENLNGHVMHFLIRYPNLEVKYETHKTT